MGSQRLHESGHEDWVKSEKGEIKATQRIEVVRQEKSQDLSVRKTLTLPLAEAGSSVELSC